MADFWAMSVVAVREGMPSLQVWVVLRRQITTGALKTYLCNTPLHVSLATLAPISGMRWPIDTCFEESKQHLGMSAYEVRSWRECIIT